MVGKKISLNINRPEPKNTKNRLVINDISTSDLMGHRTLDHVSFIARSGSMVFINSFERHEVRILSTPYLRYFMIIDSAEVERQLSVPVLSSVFKNRPAGFSHCVSLPDGEREDMFLLFRQLYGEYTRPGVYSSRMVRGMFEQMLIRVYRVCPGNFADSESDSAGRVREVQRYIEGHFSEDIRIADLARLFFISPYHLSHTFKEQVGCSPKQYIQLNRLSYAKELLQTTDLQVGQIAYKCGFGDTNNFIRAFRGRYGISPNKCRTGGDRTDE